jgi:hypothetical protein
MPNQFKPGDIVKTVAAMATQKAGGEVRFIACGDARASVGTCDKKTCIHPNADYVWVKWPTTVGLSVYMYGELEFDAANIPLADTKEQPTLPNIPVDEVKVIPGDVKEQFEKFIGKKPLEGHEIDWDIYTGKVRVNSQNVVHRKRS